MVWENQCRAIIMLTDQQNEKEYEVTVRAWGLSFTTPPIYSFATIAIYRISYLPFYIIANTVLLYTVIKYG